MMKVCGVTFFLIYSLMPSVSAQQHTFSTLYSVSVGTGNTRDFIGNISFRGFTFDYNYHWSRRFSVGISSGWYVFYQEEDFEAYVTPNGSSFWGKQFRYLNSLPVLISLGYYLHSENKLSPFFRFSVGATYNRREVAMSHYREHLDPWQFTLAPEAGFIMTIDPVFGLYASARYNNNFKTEDMSNQSYLVFNVGLIYNYSRM